MRFKCKPCLCVLSVAVLLFAVLLSAPTEHLPTIRAEAVGASPLHSFGERMRERISDEVQNACPVLAESFCHYTPSDGAPLLLKNKTSHEVSLEQLASRPCPIEKSTFFDSNSPTVLIIHTHGTESYLPSGTQSYAEGEDFRSDDPDETVVAVGNAVASRLASQGVCVLTERTMFDADGYSTAYARSGACVREYLERYPSIRYVFDIHRDALFSEDGLCKKPLTTVGGKNAAQIMLVVGGGQERWEENLTLAAQLQSILCRDYATLARPVDLKTGVYNQDLCVGSLLLEVGSCGNTLEEAICAGELFADAFLTYLREQT